jgi:hypothetical protein
MMESGSNRTIRLPEYAIHFFFSFFFLVFSESLLAGDGRWRSGGCFFAAGMRACFIVSFHE